MFWQRGNQVQTLPIPRTYNPTHTDKTCPRRTAFLVIYDADTFKTYASFEFDPEPNSAGCGTSKAEAVIHAYMNFPYLMAEHGSPVFSLMVQEEDDETGAMVATYSCPRLSGAQMCHKLLAISVKAAKALQSLPS